ncbi:BLUF domain-containing protein [Aequorivita echinoideorum]|uniref:BLUF domain-containing protein n=1 Tax=Aequorivita echinoideorum TaxID=1549647 RepID=A0ABS5S3J8_9FLAO|nr:BLUF domain-containing protein [Aequorivita echinoideorum]MBT0607004.1 BLUF domain-containing protein [Aequorivita echinoideorum]
MNHIIICIILLGFYCTRKAHFQILEGEKKVVEDLFEKIRHDERHDKIFKILERPINDGIFELYHSGFSTLYSDEEIVELATYIEMQKDPDYGRNILAILKPFLSFNYV